MKRALLCLTVLCAFVLSLASCSKSQPGSTTTAGGTGTTSTQEQQNEQQTETATDSGKVIFISTGSGNTCAITTTGTLWCWGRNNHGQVGIGTASAETEFVAIPAQESTDSTNWSSVALGETAICAVKTDGTLWCWGGNSSGLLGTLGAGDLSKELLNPTQMGSDTDWSSVASGKYHICALKSSGLLTCWGDNWYGQLGIGDVGTGTSTMILPTSESSSSLWKSIALGSDKSTCGIKTDGSLWCWGKNTTGQLGDGTTTARYIPTRVGTDTNWAQVSIGKYHACAIKDNGSLWCWGWNTYGQLGNNTTTSSNVPLEIGTDTTWSQISVEGTSSCGLKSDGSRWCWGGNEGCQFGNGPEAAASSKVPLRSDTESDWTRVVVTRNSNCGLRGSGNAFCWGNNLYCTVGDGTTTIKCVPTAVAFPTP